jgi:hypothetical protein
MEPEAATHVLQGTLKSLRKRTQRAVSKISRSEWSEYQTTLTHYTAEESAAKQAWVRNVLEEAQASRAFWMWARIRRIQRDSGADGSGGSSPGA